MTRPGFRSTAPHKSRPGVVIVPIHRPRSQSQLTEFAECGELYRLKRRVKVPTQQAAWFPGGRAYHSTTEWLDREIFAGNNPLVETGRRKLGQVWSDEFGQAVEEAAAKEPDLSKWRTAGRPTADKPNGESVDWWRTAGLEMVNLYFDWWAAGPPWRIYEMPDGKPALEVPLLAAIGGVQVVGYVDQVLQHRDTGRLLIVDKKTGARKPVVPIQLGTYNLQLRAVIPSEAWGWGSYFMARQGQLTEPEPLAAWTPQVLGEMYRNMDRAEKLGLYVPNIGSHCKGCLVRRWCVPTGGQEYKEAA